MKILREYLALTGMKSGDLAVRAGITHPNLSNYMNGRSDPNPKTIKKLSDATGIRVEKLIESAAA